MQIPRGTASLYMNLYKARSIERLSKSETIGIGHDPEVHIPEIAQLAPRAGPSIQQFIYLTKGFYFSSKDDLLAE